MPPSQITLEKVRSGIANGGIAGVFACCTAAVITPIGQFKSYNEVFVLPSSEPGPLTVNLRNELTGIQYDRVDDRYGWMQRLV